MRKKSFKILISLFLIISVAFYGYRIYLNNNSHEIQGTYNRKFKEYVVLSPQHR